jgi:hypothetical protein
MAEPAELELTAADTSAGQSTIADGSPFDPLVEMLSIDPYSAGI